MRKFFTTFGLFLITTFSFAQETKYVDTELLNVRSGAGTKYDVIHKISQGEKVTAYSTKGTWTEIELNNGTRGYVSTKFLSNSQNQKSSTDKKGNSWIGYLLVIGFVLYALNKVRKFFTGGSSSYSSSSNSQPREIEEVKPIYICKYCGTKDKDLWSLTVQNCHDSPTKKHQALEGGIQSEYICEYCGTKDKNLWSLTRQNCHDSPTKKHRPFLGGIQSEYICKYCGTKDKNLWSLTRQNCHKSPTKKHQPHF